MNISDELKTTALHGEVLQRLLVDKTIILDNSTFETILNCDVAGFIENILKLKSTTNQAPLAFGSAFHKGLECYYLGASEEDAIEQAMIEADKENLDSLADDRRNTQKLEELLRFYFTEERFNGKFIPVELFGNKLVEKSFAFELGTIELLLGGNPIQVKVIWTGKMDLVVKLGGAIWGLDHKTTSMMGPKFADDKLRSSQMLGYTWAVKMLAKELNLKEKIAGMIINAVCQRKTGAERQTYQLPYTDFQVTEWQEETLQLIKNFYSRMIFTLNSGLICQTRTSCVGKYGKCRHFDACQLAQGPRENMLKDKTFYTINAWSPLKEDD